jgi:hypothetical protein
MGRRHRADHALGGQLPQPVDREDDIPVLLKPGAVEIDRDMADQQVFRLGVSGDDPVIGIAPANGFSPRTTRPAEETIATRR